MIVGVWRRLVGHRPIVTRLVLAVAAAMTVVLLAAAGFVYWRVEYALNRQLDQDLRAWTSVVDRAVAAGNAPAAGTPGLVYQVYDADGTLVAGSSDLPRLADEARVRAIAGGTDDDDFDTGRLLPASAHAYRIRPGVVAAPGGRRVVLAAISRAKHDEALRELMVQLAIADLLALAAASFVGYRTARAALDPVESYRRAAAGARAESGDRLPVSAGRDDELVRLGHTFNALLERIDEGAARERQFLADAAHELRTPLTLMTAELEWAAHRQRSADQVHAVLLSMRGQVSRLVDLANALLELEELRAGTLQREDVEVADLVADARRDALPHDVALDVRLEHAPLPAYVDRRWVTIALANLLRNAHRHGDGQVTLEARQTGDGLEVVVSDEGAGFPPAFLDQAFDRFSRAEESRTTPGSGLGLYLVRAVAEAHGGSAEVVPGPGAAVRVVLGAAPAGV